MSKIINFFKLIFQKKGLFFTIMLFIVYFFIIKFIIYDWDIKTKKFSFNGGFHVVQLENRLFSHDDKGIDTLFLDRAMYIDNECDGYVDKIITDKGVKNRSNSIEFLNADKVLKTAKIDMGITHN